jgi:hypothetical protein
MRLVVTPPTETPEVAKEVERSIPKRGEKGRSTTIGIVVCEIVRVASPAVMSYEVTVGAPMIARPAPCAPAGTAETVVTRPAARSATSARAEAARRLMGGG